MIDILESDCSVRSPSKAENLTVLNFSKLAKLNTIIITPAPRPKVNEFLRSATTEIILTISQSEIKVLENVIIPANVKIN